MMDDKVIIVLDIIEEKLTISLRVYPLLLFQCIFLGLGVFKLENQVKRS